MPNAPQKSKKSFTDAVEEKISQEDAPNLSEVARGIDYTTRYMALRNQLRSATPKVFKAIKGAPMASIATTAIDTARMVNPEMRQEAIDETYQDAENAPWYERSFKGFFNPIETATGIGAMIGDLTKTYVESKDAERKAPSENQLMEAYLAAKRKKELLKLRRADKSPEEMSERVYFGDQLT